MQAIKEWVFRHSNLAAWIVLALGMNIILLFEARDVGLLPMQWFWLILITTLVAGACIWIVSWGDDEEAAVDATVVEAAVGEVPAAGTADRQSSDEARTGT